MAISVAVAETSCPIAVGLIWLTLICPPTVLTPSGSAWLTAIMAAFSMSAVIAGVARTGMSPDPICSAVLSLVTTRVLVCCNPVSISRCVYACRLQKRRFFTFFFARTASGT